jgi:hypothetical protein
MNLSKAPPHQECCGRLGGQKFTHLMKIWRCPQIALLILIPLGSNSRPLCSVPFFYDLCSGRTSSSRKKSWMQAYVENLHTRQPPRRERLHAREGRGEWYVSNVSIISDVPC